MKNLLKPLDTLSMLLEDSLELTSPILYEENEQVQVFLPQIIVNGVFNIHNDILAFVYEGNFYITPFCLKKIILLRQSGFTRQSFCVPSFSSTVLPLEPSLRYKWIELWQEVNKALPSVFTEECKEFAEKFSIGILSPDLLERCFKIPSEGIRVNGFYGRSVIHYPEACSGCYIEKSGCFSINHGVCVFVHHDGSTWVTRSKAVVDILPTLNYYDVGKILFVPFSNGEVIEDPVLAEKWSKCC